MSVRLWRIAATVGKYRADDLSGAAAATVGGRFNSVGTAVVYTSSTLGLSTLETLVHFSSPASPCSNRYVVEILIPEAVFERRMQLTLDVLPGLCPDWDAIPAANASREIGDEWVASGASALLVVPSAILPHNGIPDVNVMLNPAHPDFKLVTATTREKFRYDFRL